MKNYKISTEFAEGLRPFSNVSNGTAGTERRIFSRVKFATSIRLERGDTRIYDSASLFPVRGDFTSRNPIDSEAVQTAGSIDYS